MVEKNTQNVKQTFSLMHVAVLNLIWRQTSHYFNKAKECHFATTMPSIPRILISPHLKENEREIQTKAMYEPLRIVITKVKTPYKITWLLWGEKKAKQGTCS